MEVIRVDIDEIVVGGCVVALVMLFAGLIYALATSGCGDGFVYLETYNYSGCVPYDQIKEINLEDR